MDLEFDDVSLAYWKTRKTVIHNINLKLKSEKIAIVGSNGSGKTTIIKGILGLTELIHGTIRIFGEDVRHIKGMTGVASNLVDTYRIMDSTARMIIETYCSMLDMKSERILAHIEKYEMSGILAKRFREMSTGQQKVICNIMALEFGNKMALLDEPMETLDVKRRLILIEDLKNFKGSLILNTHDFSALKMLPGFGLFILIEGMLYGKFDSKDINRLYLTKGEVTPSLSVIHTSYGTFSITIDSGDTPLSVSTDLTNSLQEVMR